LVAATLICSHVFSQTLYFSDGFSGQNQNLGSIYEITPDGRVSTFATGLGGPLGMAFDGAGNLYVAYFSGAPGGGIWKFAPDGTQSTFASGIDPVALAFDSMGNLFVTDNGVVGTIYKFTSGGVRSTFATGFGNPWGLAFDSAGNLFVTDINAGAIYKFTPNGVRSTFATGVGSPFGLAFDRAGNLFVTDEYSGAVYKIAPDGSRSVFAQLSTPQGLVFDPGSGNLFVADADLDGLVVITPDGVQRTFAEGVSELGFCGDMNASIVLQPAPTSVGAPMVNLSTRVRADVNANRAISGFIIGGTAPRGVVIRAMGPGLVARGVANAISNPKLTIFDQGGNVIAQNDDWQTQIPPAAGYQTFSVASTQWAPNDPRESAIGLILPPGAYTAFADGVNGEMGVTLAEVYDADTGQAIDSRLTNMSTRGNVMTGDSVMIAGFIIGGSSQTTVTIRALGPSLSGAGLTNVLLDPVLAVMDSTGNAIANVDDTTDADAAWLGSLLPSDPREPAKKLTLPPGEYTAIVYGKGGATGIALVEIYFNQQ
jgi:sugar lactone lactonase YvrE